MVQESAQKTVRVSTPVIDHAVGARCTVDGKQGVINLASCNFWGLAGDSGILVRFVAQSSVMSTCARHRRRPAINLSLWMLLPSKAID